MKKVLFSITLFVLVLGVLSCTEQNKNNYDIDKNNDSFENTSELSEKVIEDVIIIDEKDILTEATSLLKKWKKCKFSDMKVFEEFSEFYETATNNLDYLTNTLRIIEDIHEYGFVLKNQKATQMLIDILDYGAPYSEDLILDLDVLLFKDSRWGEDSLIYPTCDLSTGLYGLYNASSGEILYQPIFSDLTVSDDLEYVYVCYKGYYGCIDKYGSKIADFAYDKPINFDNDLAIVSTNGKYGVINTSGMCILDCIYDSIEFSFKDSTGLDNSFILAYWRSSSKNDSLCGAYSLSGVKIIPHNYTGYKLLNGYLYMNKEKSWYHLFDSEGNMLIGSGTCVPDICEITLPDEHGISIGRSKKTVVNKYGVKTPGRLAYWYTYITEDMKYLTDEHYQMGLSSYKMTHFNKKGYAVASIQGTAEGSTQIRVVLNTKGEIIDRFVYLYTEYDLNNIRRAGGDVAEVKKYVKTNDDGTEFNWLPIDANDYFYYMTTTSPLGDCALYSRISGAVTEFDSIEMIDGTNLIIVKNNGSGLFGLFDGDSMVMNLSYNSISFSDGEVVATKGAEKIIYYPTK